MELSDCGHKCSKGGGFEAAGIEDFVHGSGETLTAQLVRRTLRKSLGLDTTGHLVW